MWKASTMWCLKRSWANLGEKSKFCIICIKSHILIWNTKITNGKVLNDSVMLKTELGRFLPGPFFPWDNSSLGHFLFGPFSLWAILFWAILGISPFNFRKFSLHPIRRWHWFDFSGRNPNRKRVHENPGLVYS